MPLLGAGDDDVDVSESESVLPTLDELSKLVSINAPPTRPIDQWGLQTEDSELAEALNIISQETTVLRFTESVLKWKSPTAKHCTVKIDPFKHTLLISGHPSSFFCEEAIPLHFMSDVRKKPYRDEQYPDPNPHEEGTPIPVKDFDKVFMIAYYPDGEFNFVNVSFMTFVTNDDKVAQAWRRGLGALVAYNSQFNPRFVGFYERVGRMYSHIMALDHPSAIVPLRIISEAFGKPATLTDILKRQKLLQTKKGSHYVEKEKLTPANFETLTFAVAQLSGITTVFEKFSKKANAAIQAHQLLDLLKQFRDMRANEVLEPIPTKDTAEQIISVYEPNESHRKQSQMSLDGFRAFMLSQEGDVLVPKHRSLFQEMTNPMAHYFINSSHNTYLTGSQLQSKSCGEIYRQTILSGCRCVELDAWDGEKGEPVITHGGTWCTKMPFKQGLCAIRDVAFKTSPYPMILSFENHCSLPQQKKIAQYCKQVFGDMLCDQFREGDGPAHLPNTLPSPETLRGKILIKNKRRKEDQVKAMEGGTEVENAEFVVKGELLEETEEEFLARKARSKEIDPELSAMVNYVWPITFQGFDRAAEANICYHMSSFNEKKARKLLTIDAKDFVEYCKNQFARIYPHGTRVSSSNFNPQIFWMVGCQLVALNFQTMTSPPMQLNQGKFFINGRSGYVRKPTAMTDPISDFDPSTLNPINQVVPMDITISIIAAHNVTRGPSPIQVEMQLQGLSNDSCKLVKTKPFKGKGVPIWEENSPSDQLSQTVKLPELALVRFHVTDAGSDSLGWACIPMDSIRRGYRLVPLEFARTPLAHLLVHIDLKIHESEQNMFAQILMDPGAFNEKGELKAIIDEVMEMGFDQEDMDGDGIDPGAHADQFGNVQPDAAPPKFLEHVAESPGANAGGGDGKATPSKPAPIRAGSTTSGASASNLRDSGMSIRSNRNMDTPDLATQDADYKSLIDDYRDLLHDEVRNDKYRFVHELPAEKKAGLLQELHSTKKASSAIMDHQRASAKVKAAYNKKFRAYRSAMHKKAKESIKRGKSKVSKSADNTVKVQVSDELIALEKSTAEESFAELTSALAELDDIQIKHISQLSKHRIAELQQLRTKATARLNKLVKQQYVEVFEKTKAKVKVQSRRSSIKFKEEWKQVSEKVKMQLATIAANAYKDTDRSYDSFEDWLKELYTAELEKVQDSQKRVQGDLQLLHQRNIQEKIPQDPKRDDWVTVSAEEYFEAICNPKMGVYALE